MTIRRRRTTRRRITGEFFVCVYIFSQKFYFELKLPRSQPQSKDSRRRTAGTVGGGESSQGWAGQGGEDRSNERARTCQTRGQGRAGGKGSRTGGERRTGGTGHCKRDNKMASPCQGKDITWPPTSAFNLIHAFIVSPPLYDVI